MKLLTPTAVRDDKTLQTQRELMRAQEVSKLADKTRRDLSTAEAEFKQALLGQRARWEREEQEHTKKAKSMAEELDILEKRKSDALIPIEIYKRQAEDLMREAQNAIKMAQGKEIEAETYIEALQDKLDAVGQREQDIIMRERKQEVKEEAIRAQELTTIKRTEDLTKSITQFRAEKAQAEKDIDERKTALFLRDRSQEARAEQLSRKEKELQDWSKRLKDERGVLDRIYERGVSDRIYKISPLLKNKK